MRAEYKTGAYQMMLHVNLWSVLWLAIGELNIRYIEQNIKKELTK